MINAARSARTLAWVTFCRGDAVAVVDSNGQITEDTEITSVAGECVFTACGHRWQQGTGEQVVVIRGGRAETVSDLKIKPRAIRSKSPRAE